MNSIFLEKLFGDPIDIIDLRQSYRATMRSSQSRFQCVCVNRCTEGDETYLRVRKTLEASIADFFRRLGETQRAEMTEDRRNRRRRKNAKCSKR